MADNGSNVKDEQRVTLNVLGHDNSIRCFKMKRDAPFRKLMHAYGDSADVPIRYVRLRLDGLPVNKEDTPTTLQVKDGDTIEVYLQQTGGFLVFWA